MSLRREVIEWEKERTLERNERAFFIGSVRDCVQELIHEFLS